MAFSALLDESLITQNIKIPLIRKLTKLKNISSDTMISNKIWMADMFQETEFTINVIPGD